MKCAHIGGARPQCVNNLTHFEDKGTPPIMFTFDIYSKPKVTLHIELPNIS